MNKLRWYVLGGIAFLTIVIVLYVVKINNSQDEMIININEVNDITLDYNDSTEGIETQNEWDPDQNVKDTISVNETEINESKLGENNSIVYDFNGIELGQLNLTRIMITPDEDPTTGLRITFNLDFYDENVTIIVLDEENRLVSEYETTVATIEITDNDQIEALHVYKGGISSLESHSSYSYMIRSGEQYSNLYSIGTLKEDEPTVLAFFGDIQGYKLSQYEDFTKTYEIALETAGEIDLSYIAGDVVDAGDRWAEWGFFEAAMHEYLRESIFVTAIGNHDVKGSGLIYTNSFNYPKNSIEGLEDRSYYFDLPYARVAAFDTEAVATFEEQGKWLKAIMDESNAPFKIVLMHRSTYPMAYNESHIRELSTVFEEAGIDLVLSGHDHIYSRTTMYQNERVSVSDGVTYIIGGSSTGSKYYDIKDEDVRYWKEIVYSDKNPVFTILEIGEESLNIKAYANLGGVTELIDSIVVSIEN